MADTDKIKAQVDSHGLVAMPKWLITAITGFVLSLLTVLIVTMWQASTEFARMSERQAQNTSRLEKLEVQLTAATADRFTGKEGAALIDRMRDAERELDKREIRIAQLEVELADLRKRVDKLERP